MKHNNTKILRLQLLYCGLCLVWNLVVILQRSMDMQPIGPTGSWVVILGAIVLGAAAWWSGGNGHRWVYMAVSVIIGSVALMAVYSGLTTRAAAWPSPPWQWLGLGINAFGVASLLLYLASLLRAR